MSQLKQYLEVFTFISAEYIFWPFPPLGNYETHLATMSQFCVSHSEKDIGTSSVEAPKDG